MSELRIFLADNHPLLRKGIETLIREEKNLRLVGEAEDCDTALDEVERLQPDVLVLDVAMPGNDGAEAIQQLRREAPNLRVVALTAREDTDYAKHLLENGVSGIVCKRAKPQVLLDAIHTVARGKVFIDPTVGSRMVQQYLKNGGNGFAKELSERERSVLQLIAKGYTNKEIAAELDLSVKTIETYKTRSMEKLALDSRVEIIRYAVEQGWLDKFESAAK